MNKELLILAVFFVVSCSQHPSPVNTHLEPPKLEQKQDTSILYGELANGLKYYIKKNSKPENRVLINLAVNTGSLQDPESKQGLAHYVEHMAFNGTRKFPDNQVIQHMETLGMTFGSHTNAYTSFDQTVYKLVVPADVPKNTEDALLIMRDWVDGILFNDEEVAKEQGVVLEEWRRSRLGVNARSQDIQFKHIFKNSKYLTNIPIGTERSIKNISKADLKGFYQKWYQPENMALIVVGNIEPKEIEKQISEQFATVKNTKVNQQLYEIPAHKKQDVYSFSDPEMAMGSIVFSYYTQQKRITKLSDWKFNSHRQLFIFMLNQRLSEQSVLKTPPYTSAISYPNALPDGTQGIGIFIQIKNSDYKLAYKGLMTEIERIRQYGFTESELKRAILKRLKSIKLSRKNIENAKSNHFINKIKNHFFYKAPLLSINDSANENEQILEQTTLSDLKEFSDKVLNSQHQFIYTQSPAKEKQLILSDVSLKEINKSISQKELQPYEDEISGTFWTKNPLAGTIIKENWIEQLQTYHWVLSNGAEVYFKPTEFKKDVVLFKIYSPGGSSIVFDEDYRNALSFSTILSKSGIAKTGPSKLKKLLSTTNIHLRYDISKLYHGITGSSATEDIESIMQLNHLSFTEPRIDDEELERHRQSVKDYLTKGLLIPKRKYSDEYTAFRFGNHFRALPWKEEHADEFDFNVLTAIHDEWFSNAKNFKFIFVGDIEVNELKEYVGKYIASLPSSNSSLVWKDTNVRSIKGTHTFTREYLTEDRADVSITFQSYPETWLESDSQHAFNLRNIASVKLREALREELSGTYTVSFNAWANKAPFINYGMSVNFSCDPSKVEQLVAKAEKVLRKIAEGDISEILINNEKERWFKAREPGRFDNNWWLYKIYYILRDNHNYNRLKHQEEMVSRLVKSDIQNITQKILAPENKLVSILLPKTE